MKIISYNIHKGFSSRNTKYVLEGMRYGLLELNPDIVFLQEVQGKHKPARLKKIKHDLGPQVEFLARENWPYYIYGKNSVLISS